MASTSFDVQNLSILSYSGRTTVWLYRAPTLQTPFHPGFFNEFKFKPAFWSDHKDFKGINLQDVILINAPEGACWTHVEEIEPNVKINRF